MKSAFFAFAWIGISILLSELLGYLLHRLMHSGRVGFLSRSHMRHHLLLYGPLDPQRPGSEYRDATIGETAIGNVGLEWLLPGAAILAAAAGLLYWLHAKPLHQAIFLSVSLLWSFLMFSYLHDRMHIAGFWMEKNRWLKSWFLAARRAHDIHHWALNHRGFMDKNFGIGFFFFDRCFGTFSRARPVFNQDGYEAAKRRFGDLLAGACEAGCDFTGHESTRLADPDSASTCMVDAEVAAGASPA
jgi:sterol desaturase/sphingolipid hydroxylase (fatty acid hydroxylase superfamily)